MDMPIKLGVYTFNNFFASPKIGPFVTSWFYVLEAWKGDIVLYICVCYHRATTTTASSHDQLIHEENNL